MPNGLPTDLPNGFLLGISRLDWLLFVDLPNGFLLGIFRFRRRYQVDSFSLRVSLTAPLIVARTLGQAYQAAPTKTRTARKFHIPELLVRCTVFLLRLVAGLRFRRHGPGSCHRDGWSFPGAWAYVGDT